MPGKKYELAIRISRFAVRIAARYACSMSRRWRRLSPDHEFRRLRPGAGRAPRRREKGHFALLELDELVDRPDALHRADDRDEQRALDAQREIDARRLLAGRVHVVDDVDAADEGDVPVDVTQLAVQPAQPVRAELPRRDLGTVLQQPDAALRQVALDGRREVMPGAPSVHEHADENAAPRRADERRRHDPADVVVGVDVRFQPDLALGAVDREDQRRKVLAAASQQGDSVARQEPVDHGPPPVSTVAASAAWSEIRPDGNA